LAKENKVNENYRLSFILRVMHLLELKITFIFIAKMAGALENAKKRLPKIGDEDRESKVS
jgi:hypothetical protein